MSGRRKKGAETIIGDCLIGSIRHREFLSQDIGGSYDVFVSLPPDYDQSDRSYPLLIALDANYCIGTVVETAALQEKTSEAQGIIVVGIASAGGLEAHWLRRLRDYIPGAALLTGEMREHPLAQMLIKHFGAAGLNPADEIGHADAFLRFLQKELLPKLMTELRIDANEIGLAGHSASGAFVNDVLLTRPLPFKKLFLARFGTVWYGASLQEYEAAFTAAAGIGSLEVFPVLEVTRFPTQLLARRAKQALSYSSVWLQLIQKSVLRSGSSNTRRSSMLAHALSSGIRELWPGRSYAEAAAPTRTVGRRETRGAAR